MHSATSFIRPGTFRIRHAHQAAALESLQRGIPEHLVTTGELQNPEEFASTRYLARAFELLGTESELDGDDLLVVALTNGERDMTHSFWSLIEAFAEEEAPSAAPEGEDEEEEEEEVEEDEDEDEDEEIDYDNFDEYDEERYKFDRFMSDIKSEKLSEDELDALIASEGTVDFHDSVGCTPLMAACEGYQIAIEQHYYVTLEEDSEDEDEDEDGGDEESRQRARAEEVAEAEEALATQDFNLQAILRRGPDLAARAKDGTDAMSLAAESGSAAFIDLLLSHGAQVNATTFGGAVSSLSIDVVRKLAEHHAHLAAPNLLLWACNSSSDKPHRLELVRFLVEHLHGDVNARAERALWSMQGRVRRQGTPLMVAALKEEVEVAQYLLAAGADVHAVDVYGNTALHYCSGQTWIAGDADAMWFAGEHNAQVVALLRQHGADDNARNAAGRTPADLAAEEAAND